MNQHLKRPAKLDGACARVWDLAESMLAESGEMPSAKDVANRYVAEGGNENTARTQYTRWRKSKLGEKVSINSDGGVEVVRRRLEIASDGRLLIPADMRAAMLIDGATAVMAEVADGELRIITPRAAIRKVRRMVAESDWGGGSPVDELMAERRAESLREEAEAMLPTSEW